LGPQVKYALPEAKKIAEENNKQLSIHIFGQESTEETYAIAKADLLIKGGNTSNEKRLSVVPSFRSVFMSILYCAFGYKVSK